MAFIDDIKTDQRTQILVAGVVVFALLFPGYFYYAASLADDDLVFSGPAADYEVTGEISFHVIGSGSETISDGGTAEVSANSDAIDVDDLNIIGFRMTLTHTDNEENDCGPGSAPQDDEVSSSGGIGDYSATNSGTDANIESNTQWLNLPLWNNASVVPANISFIAEDISLTDLENELDGGLTGLGEYTFELGVSVNRGNSFIGEFLCENEDTGETVDWKLELISLESSYEIAEEEEEEEEEESDE